MYIGVSFVWRGDCPVLCDVYRSEFCVKGGLSGIVWCILEWVLCEGETVSYCVMYIGVSFVWRGTVRYCVMYIGVSFVWRGDSPVLCDVYGSEFCVKRGLSGIVWCIWEWVLCEIGRRFVPISFEVFYSERHWGGGFSKWEGFKIEWDTWDSVLW